MCSRCSWDAFTLLGHALLAGTPGVIQLLCRAGMPLAIQRSEVERDPLWWHPALWSARSARLRTFDLGNRSEPLLRAASCPLAKNMLGTPCMSPVQCLHGSDSQVSRFSRMCQSSSLPNCAPSQAKYTSCCFQTPHVTSSGTFPSGYVENCLVQVQIIPLGFPISVQAAISMDHSVDFIFPEVTRWPSAL